MKIKTVNQTNGVKAFITGFSVEELSTKIEACQSGECTCACDPEIMQKIESIDLLAAEEGSAITIIGDVDAKTLAPMIQECLTGGSK